MKKAFDTKVYFRDGWLKNYTFVYVKIALLENLSHCPIFLLVANLNLFVE